MCETAKSRVPFLVLLISVFLIHRVSAWRSGPGGFDQRQESNSFQNELEQDYPPASVQATPMKTVLPSTNKLSVNSQQTMPNHEAFPTVKPKQSDQIQSSKEGRTKQNKRLGDPARTLLEIQSAIRALANTHNELLRTISRNEPWWYRHWILISWSYSKSHLLNSDRRLYSSLKGLSNVTIDEDILQNMKKEDFEMPEEIQTYLQNLRCLAHSQTVQASPKPYSLFRDEDWRRWKERLDLIRGEVSESLLKYELENQVNVLIDKIDEFLKDFSDQYFRSHTTWIYYFEDSWFSKIFEKSAGVATLKAAVTKRLHSVRKTIVDIFETWNGDFEQKWKAFLGTVLHFKRAKWPLPLEELATSMMQVLDSPFTKLKEFFTDPAVYAVVIIIVALLIVPSALAYLIKLPLILIEAISEWRDQWRERGRRAPFEEITNFSEDANNTSVISSSTMPQEHTRERNLCQPKSRPSKGQTGAQRPKEIRAAGEPLIPLSGDAVSRTSNESAVSFKMARALPGTNRKGAQIGSINEQGPIRKPKVTDSIRVGGRRINMVYDTRDECMADDSREEIVAVVCSAKENSVKQPRKPLSKKQTKQTKQDENRSGTGDTDKVTVSMRQRKSRRTLEGSKRLLTDASNRSLGTEDTRVLRSRSNSASTKSSDALANRDMQGKSTIPRRRSARLSAAHSNENAS